MRILLLLLMSLNIATLVFAGSVDADYLLQGG